MTETTNPPPIVEFLRARLNELEPEAFWYHEFNCESLGQVPFPCTCNHPAFLEADIAAKRAILDIHKIYVEERRESPNIKYSDTWKPDIGCVNCDWDNDCRAIEGNGYPCDTVKLLASPYATHPGYQQEWAVVAE